MCPGCEPWEDVRLPTTFKTPDTYHYVVLALKLVQARRVGLTPVEDAEVVVITPVGVKDIGDEFQDRGLPDSSLSNEKDGVWCFRVVRRSLDDPLLERLYVAGKYGQKLCIKRCCGNSLDSRNISIIPDTGFSALVVRQRIAEWVSKIDGRLAGVIFIP